MDNPFIIRSFISNFLSFVPSSLPQDRFQPPERFICVATYGQHGVHPARTAFAFIKTNAVSAAHGRARASGQGLVHSSTFWARRQIDDFLTDAVDPFGILRFRAGCAVGSPARSVGHKGERVSNAGLSKKKKKKNTKKKKNQNTKNHVMTQGANMHYSAHNAVVCQCFNFVPLVIRYDKSSAGEKII